MSRTRRFLGGVSTGYAYQLAVTAVGLWLTPFLLSRLGTHDYGLWLTATQLMAYLALLDFGVLTLLTRDAAYATGRAGGLQQTDDLGEVVGRTLRVVLWQLPFIAAAALGAWWLFPAGWSDLRVPVAMLLAAFVLTYPLRVFQGTLQGIQDLAFVAGAQLTAWAVGTALTIALVVAGWGLLALAVGLTTTQVLSLGACACRMASRFPGAVPRHVPRLTRPEWSSYLVRAFWVSLGHVAHTMSHGTDLVLVAWFFGPAAVVPYACTQKLIAVLTHQPQLLTQAAAPALSELRMAATREKLFDVTSSLSLALVLSSGAVFAVVLGVNGAFVSWWVGADRYGGAALTAVFASAMLVRHWNTALTYSLFSFGYERRLSLTAIADGGVTLGASAVLAQVAGPIGVPFGFLAGALLVSVPLNLSALAREAGVSPARFCTPLAGWAARMAVVLPLALGANLFVRSASIAAVLGVAAAIGGAYAALMLPVALGPPLGRYVRQGLGPVLRLWPGRAATPQTALSTTDGGPVA